MTFPTKIKPKYINPRMREKKQTRVVRLVPRDQIEEEVEKKARNGWRLVKQPPAQRKRVTLYFEKS